MELSSPSPPNWTRAAAPGLGPRPAPPTTPHRLRSQPTAASASLQTLLDRIDPRRRPVEKFALHSPDLDDVFFALTDKPRDADAATRSRSPMSPRTCPRPPSPPSRAMRGRSLTRLLRSPDSMIMGVALPDDAAAAVRVRLRRRDRHRHRYIDYVVPGIILLCAAFGSSTTAVRVSADMTQGIVDRFRSMPIARSSFLFGHVSPASSATSSSAAQRGASSGACTHQSPSIGIACSEILRGAAPSTSATQSWKGPPRFERKTTCEPLGDQSGVRSSLPSGGRVRSCSEPVSRSCSHSSDLPLRPD